MVVASGANRVAVVIPVYHAEFLAEALDSVFAQSHPPDEVVVVDDGSPEPSVVTSAVAPFAGRLSLFRQENLGVGAARNLAIRTTSADFVAFLDADDRWMPDFLERQLATLVPRRDLDVVYSDGLLIGRAAPHDRTFMSMSPSRGEVTLESLLSQECTVLLSAVVARRAAIEAVGGFDEALRRGQDFDLWLRLAARGARFAYQPQALVARRTHDHNLSGTAVDEIERPIRVLEKAVRALPLNEREQRIARQRLQTLAAELLRERGKEQLRQGDYRTARRSFVGAWRQLRTWKLLVTVIGLHTAPHMFRTLARARLEPGAPDIETGSDFPDRTGGKSDPVSISAYAGNGSAATTAGVRPLPATTSTAVPGSMKSRCT